MTNYEKIQRAIQRAGYNWVDFTIYTNTGIRGENKIIHNADFVGRGHTSSMTDAKRLDPSDGILGMARVIKNMRFGYRAMDKLNGTHQIT